MQGPNIFKYAPKEFSQDTFICYLVACAAKASGELKQCGLAFVRTLFRSGASDEILGPDGNRTDSSPHDGPCEVSDVINIKCQYNITPKDRLDVYFQAKIDGRLVTFIIESKKDGEADIDQLNRYLKAVIEDKREKDLLKPIFFKTGYVFSRERMAVERAKYSVFEAKDMKSFLDGQDVARENEILRQYAEYMTCLIETRADIQARYDFNHNYVQWEFMLRLRTWLESAAGKWQPLVPAKLSGPPEDDWFWCGLGKGEEQGSGNPYTQYWFAKHLFWRLDSGMPLRFMINLINAGKKVEESEGEVRGYRDCFNQVLREVGLDTGDVGLRMGRECTIGSIKTAKFQGMTVCEFLDKVTRVHISFLDMIGAKK